jgi:1-acyl-sn-glycerol-3-phosphate acyltransferase
MTILRSSIFFVWFVLASVVIHLAALPALLLPRIAMLWAGHAWCVAVLWGLRVFAGQNFEVRGSRPPDGALIASKHMSMWDTLALYTSLNMPLFVLKRELLAIPFYGWFVRKAGMIAIDREGRASALRKMTAAVRAAIARGRAVIIFPEGTRKKPDAEPAYKPGVAALYGQLGGECVPVALNSGLYWTGPAGFVKRPGTIILEFLPPIPPGLKRREFMATLQDRIETATQKLVREGRVELAG